MTKKVLVLSLVLVAGALLLSGYGKSLADRAAEGLIEKSTGGTASIDSSGQSMKINVNGVNVETGAGVSLPVGFPTDVYVIEGKLISAISNAEQKSYSVYIETSFTPQEAYDQYNKALTDAGWQVVTSGNFGGALSLSVRKDSRAVTVVVSTGENSKTVVSLNEYPKN